MSSSVFDASGVLAWLNNEPGDDQVIEAARDGAAISAVNISEVVAKLDEAGQTEDAIRQRIETLGLEVHPFNEQQAYRAGMLRTLTRAAGLSFGDRACLALAQHLGLPVLTTDHAWQSLPLGIDIRVIR